jgi:hypothetical protein
MRDVAGVQSSGSSDAEACWPSSRASKTENPVPHPDSDRDAGVHRRRDQLVELVGPGQRVLLLGPADEAIAALLAERGCEVTRSAPGPDDLGAGDATYDVVLLGALVTTDPAPQALLKHAASLLGDGGRVLVTVPNVAHAARRLALLAGAWPDAEAGGSASARHFTKDALCDLLEGAGLVVDALHATVSDPMESALSVPVDRLPDALVEWVRHQPDALCDWITATARPEGADRPGDRVDGVPARPPVRADRPLSEARRVDEHTDRARALEDDEHRRLTTRDAIIGLEASTLTAELRRNQALEAVKEWKRRTHKWRAAHDQLAAEVVALADHKRPGDQLRALAERYRGSIGGDAKGPQDES